MGKKKKKNRKNKNKYKIKGQILSASQSVSGEASRTHAPINQTASATNPIVGNPASASSSPAVNSAVIPHINTDLRFFFIVTVALAIILAGLYILDQQTNLVLNLGQWLWNVLGLS